MPRPNLPAGKGDGARLLARVKTTERKYRAPSPNTFAELDDVDAVNANDGDVATFVAATGKIEMKPGGSGFPLGPEDDGSQTGLIEYGSIFGSPAPGAMFISVTSDTPGDASYLGVFIPAQGGVGAAMQTSVGDISILSTTGGVLLQAGSPGVTVDAIVVTMASLPTSDPGLPGQLWNDSGTVKVSL